MPYDTELRIQKPGSVPPKTLKRPASAFPTIHTKMTKAIDEYWQDKIAKMKSDIADYQAEYEEYTRKAELDVDYP